MKGLLLLLSLKVFVCTVAMVLVIGAISRLTSLRGHAIKGTPELTLPASSYHPLYAFPLKVTHTLKVTI